METKLYPGIPFSPPAALTDNVGAGDTIIPVSDVEAFPPAPNLATIGADEEGETVLYAAKTATALSGCTRGVEGTARAWGTGEPIARNWTAKDHGDLIAAVGEADTAAQDANKAAQEAKEAAQKAEEGAEPKGTAETAVRTHNSSGTAHGDLFAAKQNKLVGQPGQVVGFDSMGLAYAIRGWSNLNLLDNAYWANKDVIINQKGQTEYNGNTNSYTIDRWKFNGSSRLELLDDGIKISTSQQYGGIWQAAETTFGVKAGDTVTFSVVFSEVQNGWYIDCHLVSEGIASQTEMNPALSPGLISVTMTTPNSYVPKKGDYFRFFICSDINSATQCVVVAAKFELGPQQTLAHQDADGNWVLNDPPPNKALELAKCQRYQVVEVGAVSEMPGRTETNDTLFTLFIPTAIRMRANPTVTIPGLIIVGNGKAMARDVTAITGAVHEGGINISFKLEESSGIGALQALFCHAPNGYTLDANL